MQGGNTPLDEGHEARDERTVEMLREHGGKHSLFYAMKKGMHEEFAELIKEGADVNQQSKVSGAGPQMETLHMCRLCVDVCM